MPHQEPSLNHSLLCGLSPVGRLTPVALKEKSRYPVSAASAAEVPHQPKPTVAIATAMMIQDVRCRNILFVSTLAPRWSQASTSCLKRLPGSQTRYMGRMAYFRRVRHLAYSFFGCTSNLHEIMLT